MSCPEPKERMKNMKEKFERNLLIGNLLELTFVLWTVLIQKVDVKPLGVNGTNIGFSTFNIWFHNLTGVHMNVYTITDWMGLIPIVACMIFGTIGLCQLIKRRSLLKVDKDIIILGVYYIIVILAYAFFEIVPINYRPILIDGFMEASYPSSTTLLVLSVMPTVIDQAVRRINNLISKRVICVAAVIISLYMVIGRTVSGVHWFTDIVGSVIFSIGLFIIYRGFVIRFAKNR